MLQTLFLLFQCSKNQLCNDYMQVIEIGPNVDFAFMSMCTYAIDEIFSENEN